MTQEDQQEDGTLENSATPKIINIMSFFSSTSHVVSHREELCNAWKSLSYDFYHKTSHPHSVQEHPLLTFCPRLLRSYPLTPPLSPDKDIIKPPFNMKSNRSPPIILCSSSEKRSTDQYLSDRNCQYALQTIRQNSCYRPDHPSKVTLDLAKTNLGYVSNKYPFEVNRADSSGFSLNFDKDKLAGQNQLVRKRLSDEEGDLMPPKRMKKQGEEIACQVHGLLSLPGCREPRY